MGDDDRLSPWRMLDRYPYSRGLPSEGDKPGGPLVRHGSEGVLLLFCEVCGSLVWQDDYEAAGGVCGGPRITEYPDWPPCQARRLFLVGLDDKTGDFQELGPFVPGPGPAQGDKSKEVDP